MDDEAGLDLVVDVEGMVESDEWLWSPPVDEEDSGGGGEVVVPGLSGVRDVVDEVDVGGGGGGVVDVLGFAGATIGSIVTPSELTQSPGTAPGPPAMNLMAAHCTHWLVNIVVIRNGYVAGRIPTRRQLKWDASSAASVFCGPQTHLVKIAVAGMLDNLDHRVLSHPVRVPRHDAEADIADSDLPERHDERDPGGRAATDQGCVDLPGHIFVRAEDMDGRATHGPVRHARRSVQRVEGAAGSLYFENVIEP